MVQSKRAGAGGAPGGAGEGSSSSAPEKAGTPTSGFENASKAAPMKTIGHNGGALKAENFPKIMVKEKEYSFVAPGTTVTKIYNFAGKGSKKALRVESKMIQQYGGKQGEWQHTTGDAVITYKGETKIAEVHWFQEPSVGIVQPRVKRWRQ